MMRRPIAFLALLLLIVAAAPAEAASRFSIISSTAQTSTAQGGAVAVGGITEMVVLIDCTAVSGTTPQITVYLQSSRDGGQTWFDLTHEGAVVLSSGASAGAQEATGSRNIVSGLGATFKALARYRVFGDFVRVAWVISGTSSPTFTFQADAVGK